ncbi:probable DNA-3-methyladenine glycosylase [Galendromus occidentalis]|uniref:DNA-3-methyladenine glycosylase n=1 Tax=Galendromus occidentalis TaxID=34638 RepID=A0AAJ6QPA5_9ACAR|nr:probable DNA-3-methyladenine glycosylase [Galendromus occidentalis]
MLTVFRNNQDHIDSTSPRFSEMRGKRQAEWSPSPHERDPNPKNARLVEDFDSTEDRDTEETTTEDAEICLRDALENCRHFLAFRTPQRVGRDFFDVGCVQLARKLLGNHLVRRLKDGRILRAKIVETESYLGGQDKASHSFNNRRTERNEPMYMEPGTAYVYLTYGMYYCFNISSRGEGAAVLLRSAKPLSGVEDIRGLRGVKLKDGGRKLRLAQLLNGPSKLCTGMAICKDAMNKEFVPSSELLWIEYSQDAAPAEHHIVTSSRIGVESVPREWACQPLRFYLLEDATFVSVRDRAAEKAL